MNAMIAYCGLACESCPIHLATIEIDELKKRQMRVTIARLCRERYGMNLQPEDVADCDGCRSESGRLFSTCRTCGIRACARERSLDSCAYCPDYACDKLQKLFVDDPTAQTRLEVFRSTK